MVYPKGLLGENSVVSEMKQYNDNFTITKNFIRYIPYQSNL